MRKFRDIFILCRSILFAFVYLPHMVLYAIKAKSINIDLLRYQNKLFINVPKWLLCLSLLHTDKYFRRLFYHRIGPISTMLISWLAPADRYFIISKTTRIGEGMYCAHPYSTIINAKVIGRNFSCRQLTTIGNKFDGLNNERPTIGDNVSLGANVSIIGDITIGDNVIIGAGTIVVKDVPSDSIVVGNPARIINKREV